ncbi:MAG: hypothetical protein AUI47_06870 [Acidobacteria bacterium 13_1_40CM_2_68_5]|nr:MAG: hypothetical protein AUI47_06870 [Acidobacteria bacterium 13_1_40CM_2_68_5]
MQAPAWVQGIKASMSAADFPAQLSMLMLGMGVPAAQTARVDVWTETTQLLTRFALHGGRFGVSSLPLLFVSSSQGGPGFAHPAPHFAPTMSSMPLLLQSSFTPGSAMGLPLASGVDIVPKKTPPGLGSAMERSRPVAGLSDQFRISNSTS